MTVAVETSRKNYTGDASTTVFPYDFLIFVTGDLEVYEDGVLQTETTHYTVSGAGVAAGGNVIFVTAPASSVAITIIRALAFTQPTDYVENNALPAAIIETSWDRVTMLAKQNNERLDRSIILPVQSTLTAIELPVPGAGQVIGWNTGGTALALYTIGLSQILNVMTASGDLIAGGASGGPKRLAVGTNGCLMNVTAGEPAWFPAGENGSLMNVTAGEPSWLHAGTNGTILQMGATDPSWVAGEAVIRDYHDFNEQASAPANPAASDRRFYFDTSGTPKFKNSAGAIVVIDAFAAGTKMVFAQASAPLLWTQVASYNDQVLRFVSGTGDGSGGDASIKKGGVTTGGPSVLDSAHDATGQAVAGDGHTHLVTYNIKYRDVICCSKD